MNKKIFSEVIGWYGFIAVFLGYLLVSFGYVLPTNLTYIILNFTGSLGMAILTFKKKAWSLTAFYFIWATIGIVTFIRII